MTPLLTPFLLDDIKTDTTVLNCFNIVLNSVISQEADCGQNHLNVMTVLCS